MGDDLFRIPSDDDIDAAERLLGIPFPAGYREFLKSGSDVASACFDAPVIFPEAPPYLNLITIATEAWDVMGVPRELLPFIEDNGDYFCVTPDGGVVYWSHNGPTDERWSDIASWHQQVCIELR